MLARCIPQRTKDTHMTNSTIPECAESQDRDPEPPRGVATGPYMGKGLQGRGLLSAGEERMRKSVTPLHLDVTGSSAP